MEKSIRINMEEPNTTQKDMLYKDEIISDLRNRRTVTLVFLSIITLGVYGAHYMHRLTKAINNHLPEDLKIGILRPWILILGTYIALILSSYEVYLSVKGYHDLEQMTDGINSLVIIIYTLSLITWLFTTRDRIHYLLDIEDGSKCWIRAFYLVIFSVFYLNYKINTITYQPINRNNKDTVVQTRLGFVVFGILVAVLALCYKTFIYDVTPVAIYDRDKIALERSISIDTLNIYQEFLDNNPKSVWKRNFIYYRDRAALQLAKNTNTHEAYMEFMDKYPGSEWMPQALFSHNKLLQNNRQSNSKVISDKSNMDIKISSSIDAHEKSRIYRNNVPEYTNIFGYGTTQDELKESLGCSCGTTNLHSGTDWSSLPGTAIPAASDGTIVEIELSSESVGHIGQAGSCGRYIVVLHIFNNGKSVYTRYTQIGNTLGDDQKPIQVGARVVKGQAIGQVGRKGFFHFEVRPFESVSKNWRNVAPVDPSAFDFDVFGKIPGK